MDLKFVIKYMTKIHILELSGHFNFDNCTNNNDDQKMSQNNIRKCSEHEEPNGKIININLSHFSLFIRYRG
jgi:hypothetical protein